MDDRNTSKQLNGGTEERKHHLRFVLATVNDADKLLAIESQLKDPYYLTVKSLEDAKEQLTINQFYWIHHKDELAGIISFRLKPENTLYLCSLVVLSPYRGLNIGEKACHLPT